MIERPLMTVDELKSMPKGHFVVMKTGCHPMRTRLKLFIQWGIRFNKKPYEIPEHSARKVHYADKNELESAVRLKYSATQQGAYDIAEYCYKLRSPRTTINSTK